MEGRFPANLILDEEAAELLDEQINKTNYELRLESGEKLTKNIAKNTIGNTTKVENSPSRYFKIIQQDRFQYIAKVSKKERNLGCEELEKGNNHSTVKPIKLMMYLIKLITPKNGVVMDCFMGSGSTGVGAALAGFNFIGMEQDIEYFNIAESRITHYKEYEKIIK